MSIYRSASDDIGEVTDIVRSSWLEVSFIGPVGYLDIASVPVFCFLEIYIILKLYRNFFSSRFNNLALCTYIL